MTQFHGMTPPKPPKKKSNVLGGVIVLGVVGALCCGGAFFFASGDDDSKASSGGAKAVGLNTPARDGKFEFVVESVKCGQTSVGSQYLNQKAQGQFCSVAMSVKNIDKKPQTLTSATHRAIGVDGSEYEADGTATMYANDQNQFFLNSINPGNQVKGNLVFDIPAGGKITKLKLHDSLLSGGVTVAIP